MVVTTSPLLLRSEHVPGEVETTIPTPAIDGHDASPASTAWGGVELCSSLLLQFGIYPDSGETDCALVSCGKDSPLPAQSSAVPA